MTKHVLYASQIPRLTKYLEVAMSAVLSNHGFEGEGNRTKLTKSHH